MDSMWRKTEDGKVDLRLGRKVEKIASARKRVTDDQGSEHFYEKLLLATGGTPRQLPFDGGQIIYYRNLRDYQRLRALTEKARRFAVIGGRFIGSRIATSVAPQGLGGNEGFSVEATLPLCRLQGSCPLV